jgi:FkbM family methyltransferase
VSNLVDGIGQRLTSRTVASYGRAIWRPLRLTRKALLKVADPTVTVDVAGRPLRMPLSHELPHNVRTHPRYSRNVGVLARAVADTGLPHVLIDVGANVGDTVAFVLEQVPDMQILCIDADSRYVELLRENTARLDGVRTIGPLLLADTSDGVSGRVETTDGTGRVVTTVDRTPSATLDDVLAGEATFAHASILKSDTDGFEGKVLRGAIGLLRAARPVLHIEYDPRLLAAAGTDGCALLAWLAELGYERAVVYDNLGDALTTCTVAGTTMGDLHRYALGKATLYYDLVIAAADKAELIDAVAQAEGLR